MRVLHVGYGFRPWRLGGLIAYAEDLMDAQVARGHEVAYFFSGRRYPAGRRDRLRRWRRRGVEMRELVNSTIVFGGDDGTLSPEHDIDHAPTERCFRQALDELEPEVVHFQELIGLPSSLIEIASERGAATLMTLQDYLPLCPTIKLFDADGRICLRHDVGADCARCSAGAPSNALDFVSMTVDHDLRQALPAPVARGLMRGKALAGRASRSIAALRDGRGDAVPASRTAEPERYQARRDANVERLSMLDASVAQSRRVAEIYTDLGVDPARMRVMHLTLRHLQELRPKAIEAPPRPLRIVTLNGCSSVAKGREVVLGGLAELERRGLGPADFTLTVFGRASAETMERLARFDTARYAGSYRSGDLERLLEPFHVGLMPSVWEEAYGYVGVEFLACGLPVIASARGGMVDYTRDGETGWTNLDCSPQGLADIVAGIVAEPRQVLDLNARIRDRRDEIVKPFERHAEEMLELYAELAGRPTPLPARSARAGGAATPA